MTNNLIKILEARSNKNFKVEPVYIYSKNYELLTLFLKKQKYINYKNIFKIIEKKFLPDMPIGNIMFDINGKIVGFLGTKYSNRIVIGKKVLQCCLHTWIVNISCRLYSYKLIIPIINKNIFIFTFTPIKQLVGLFKKMGFENKILFAKINFIFPYFNLVNNTKNNFNISPNSFYNFLSSYDQTIFNDHNNKDLIFLFYKDNSKSNEYLYIIAKKTYKKLFPCLELLYISNKKIYNLNYKNINFFFLKKYKTLFIIDYIYNEKNLFHSRSRTFSLIKKRDICFINIPKNFYFDCLYSEFVC